MPIYEYACDGCGQEFEAWQGITEPPIGYCPQCRGTNVRKLVSLSSFSLKGTGWYATDYGRPSSIARTTQGGRKKSHDDSTTVR
ncbi:MAG: zinc ribbon domain-containing protein [Pseudomonadota bacterium]